VAHTYNPSYSGGRDHKDHGSNQLRQTVCETLPQKKEKKKNHKKGLVEKLKVEALSSNSSTAKKKKDEEPVPVVFLLCILL
jgi:hypothetical protein